MGNNANRQTTDPVVDSRKTSNEKQKYFREDPIQSARTCNNNGTRSSQRGTSGGNFVLTSPPHHNPDIEELNRRLNGGLSLKSSKNNSRRGSSAGCRTPKRSGSNYPRRNLDVINSGQEFDNDPRGSYPPTLNLN